MKNIKNEIITEWKRISLISDKYFSDSKIDDINAYITTRLNEINPVLVVYGVYNSGKSTLINALFGEEIAEVGDTPTTTKIHQYRWGEWTVYDTPGIDAPTEHANITEEHLLKSECILFVISTEGDFEAKIIYDKIAELAKRKKQIFLLFNDKTGAMDENTDKQTKIIDQVTVNLHRAWKRKQINENFPDMFIANLNSALKGKLEVKSTLLKKSGIELLENKIEQFMRMRGETDIINTILIDTLIPYCESLQAGVTDKLSDPIVKELEGIRDNLEYNRRKIKLDAERILRNGLDNVVAELSNFSGEHGEGDINNLLQIHIDKIIKEIDIFIENAFRKISKEWEAGSVSLLKTHTLDLPVPQTLKSNIPSHIEKIPGLISKIPSAQIEQITSNVGKNVLLKLRSLKFPGIKGRWDSTLGKWAGNTGKIAGKLLPVAIAAVETFLAFQRQKAYEQQMEAKAKAYEMMCNRIRYEVSNEIADDINSVLNDLFSEHFKEIENKLDSCNKAKSALSADIDNLNDILDNLTLMIG